MGIRALYKQTWESASKGISASSYDYDIIPEKRAIIVNRKFGNFLWGQLIMMFDDSGKMSLLTARHRIPFMALASYLHTLEQVGRLREEGIECIVVFERGLVTCTYSKHGWLQHVAQPSAVVQRQQVQSVQTLLEEDMASSE